MNKSSPEYIRVREEMAKTLHKQQRKLYFASFLDSNWEELSSLVRFAFLEDADSILSIKGIAVESDDQHIEFTELLNLPDLANFKKVI